MMRPARQHRRAFTLIEMAITLGIIGILTGIGIWMSANMMPTWRTRAAALEFSTHVHQCRALAVRANAECRILLVDYDPDVSDPEAANIGEYWIALGNKSNNSTSWDILPVDSEVDGTDDDSSQGKINLADGHDGYKRYVSIDDWGDGFIGGPNYGNDNAIVFGPRGFVTNPVTDFTGEGYIDITFVNKFARGEGLTEDFIVKIARSGMARIDNSVAEDYDNLWSGTATSSSAP
jgi:prepilin-type N-terminal cleavage/methylation domain-containing protein